MCNCGSTGTVTNYNTSRLNKKNTSKNVTQSTVEKKNISDVCNNVYDDIQKYNLILINILKNNNSKMLIELNKQFRTWVKELPNKCPHEDNFKAVKIYLENEYSEYFS